MAGNVRFDSSSASPEELGFTGSYSNGQRGNYASATLDRSGSFREGGEGRLFSCGASTPRASASSVGDVATSSQCLLLDPITIGDQKYPRSGEIRRVLGISVGSATEDNSFGAAHLKPPPPVATEELKRFKASVQDSTSKARGRIKRLNESLLKLNKYCEALNLKKQQRNEMSTNERSGGLSLLKMGIQIHRNPADLGTQRLEDRTKNIVLNKRVRSSVAELRADGRNSTLPRQPLVMGKDRDVFKDGAEGSDLAEEKVRRLPAGGEGWDKKMKRKRSVGTVFARSTDSDGEAKRIMHQKINNEPGLQSYDAQGFRSGSFNGTGGINKSDSASSVGSLNARAIPKNEQEKVSLTRDFAAGMNKERLLTKANNKLNILEDNHTVSPSPMTKGKASRAPRTGSVLAANTSPIFPRTSGVVDGWEHPSSINKVNAVGGSNNRKRPMTTGSSSPPITQWVGQRPQKMSRTRRANVVSPVSNHDEVQMSAEGGHPSDFASRVTSVGINGSLAKDVVNGTQQARVKHENVSSPVRLSESEESGAGENREHRPKEKGTGSGGVEERSMNQNVGPSVLLTKKNKILTKEDIGDGVRRQGRTGRGASSTRTSISPMREKLESPASTKPLRSTRPVSEKNGSKSGRPPLKKLSDRKAFARLGQTPTGSSPDFTGESDDDREDLLAAANFACNASYLSCLNTFWKKMDCVFAPICLEDSSYLKQQLKSAEELDDSLSEMFNHGNNNVGDLAHEVDFQSQAQLVSKESERSMQDQAWRKKLARTVDVIDQGQDDSILCVSVGRRTGVTPLYQRVLSALIVEDESEEFEENSGGRNISFQHNRDGSPGDSCLSIEFEPRNKDGIEFDYDSMLVFQTQEQFSVNSFSCNGSPTINRATGSHSRLCNDELFERGHGFTPSKIRMFPVHSENNDGKPAVHTSAPGLSALDCQYDQMSLEDKLLMELQSIGLYPETVPDLADGEDDSINQDIIELHKGLHQQVGKKKAHLNKILKIIEDDRKIEGRALELFAMNRLVELAYKKLLATRGSSAARLGVPKVSKQAALTFMKRTLARCRKFEDTGKSCFSEPALRDVIFAAPTHENDAEPMGCTGLADATGMPNSQHDAGPSGSFPNRAECHDLHNDKSGRGAPDAFGNVTHSCDQDFAKTGPILNRGKKKEVLLDDVSGNASFRVTSSLGNTLLGGAKGKRSERERDKGTLARNSIMKAGRASQNNVKGDRKTKSKPKQKTAQLSTSGDGNKDASSNKKREIGVMSQRYNPRDSSRQTRETTDITDLQELGLDVANDLGDPQDLSGWFNFEDDGLPENDIAGLEIPMDGLEIPMDDLSELNMLL